jgi:hypothetical protein
MGIDTDRYFSDGINPPPTTPIISIRECFGAGFYHLSVFVNDIGERAPTLSTRREFHHLQRNLFRFYRVLREDNHFEKSRLSRRLNHIGVSSLIQSWLY